jgi:phasin family protein
MLNSRDEMQKVGMDNMNVAMKSFDAATKGFQTIAAELMNYQKKAFEDGAVAMQELINAKSPQKAMEIQSQYVKSAYEDLVAQVTRIGELYLQVAKESCKPLEGVIGNKTPTT